ncbi:MAG: polysaccharide deacetylase family protein [Pseudohongiellaceae bacterium]
MSAEQHRLLGLVSIHDVMPDTLDRCLSLIDSLGRRGVKPITLLVVPGLPWSDAQLATLKSLQESSLVLAGHGWRHRAAAIRGPYHRLHSLLLSRRAAEHLSLSAEEIRALIARSFAWFGAHDLASPTLYVPPAWALGRLDRAELPRLPFRFYEVLSGVLAHDGRLQRLPLTGYEADTRWRAAMLAPWNALNAQRARRSGKPLRIGLHPYDDEMLLRRQMQAQIDSCDGFVGYDTLMGGGMGGAMGGA